MSKTPDITIIGSGVISLMTARELSIAGANVTIIEKSALGQESSWAGGGILLPLYPWRQDTAITQLVIHSIDQYHHLSEQLAETTGIDSEWTDCGLLVTENPDFDDAIAWCRQHHIPFQQPEHDQLKPFNCSSDNPIWMPTIAQIRNPRLLKALVSDLKQRNVEFIHGCELTGLQHDNHRIQSISTSGGNFQVNHLLLATGAWSGQLWTQLFETIPGPQPEVHPVVGQIILFDTQPGLLEHMILADRQYLIPRRDGKILVGSSVEHRGFDKTTTEQARQQLQQFATQLFAPLENFPIDRHWAGIRPGTQHGVPYICHHPKFENLSLNAGHFRNGLAMGPASAQLMADLILKRPPLIDPTPYSFTCHH